MSVRPEQLDLIGGEVAIRWSDGSEDFFPMQFLRRHSPSAENRGETDIMGQRHGGTDQTDFSGVKVVSWEPVGGYAVRFQFSDGHNTGLFSFDFLKQISRLLRET